MNAPGELLEEVRRTTPLVQCITNYVAMNVAANVLLAAGASPAMVHHAAESGEFAEMAAALTVNIGTLSPDWVDGMKQAIAGAQRAGRPWVLDPVAHFATALRRRTIVELLALRPTVIRGNASEIIALAGGHSAGRGADSGDSVEHAEQAARTLARRLGAVVAATGATDFVTDGTRALRVHGGAALMPRVTALGCSLTCLVGAFVAVAPAQPLAATAAALACFAAAGARAAAGAPGPGTFAVQLLDALYTLEPATLDRRVEALPA